MGSKRMSAGRFAAINNANKAGMKLKLETLAAAKTLDAEDSGKIFALNLAGGFDVTLPNASDAGSGWYCRFVVKVAPTTAYTISATAGDGDNMHGCVMNSEGGVGDKTGGTGTDVLTFVANKAMIGDYVELFTDGTLWYVTAQVEQNDAFTLS